MPVRLFFSTGGAIHAGSGRRGGWGGGADLAGERLVHAHHLRDRPRAARVSSLARRAAIIGDAPPAPRAAETAMRGVGGRGGVGGVAGSVRVEANRGRHAAGRARRAAGT